MVYIRENWWYLLLVIGFAYMMLKGGGCCGGGHAHGGHNHNGHNGGNGHFGTDEGDNQVDMVLDPVCGMYVSPETAIKQNIDGKTYYFCSENCRKTFMRNHQ
ncbi:MAG: YHS domain-containing protein [Caulobacteraceae bacterium]